MKILKRIFAIPKSPSKAFWTKEERKEENKNLFIIWVFAMVISSVISAFYFKITGW